jgi:hypothetical protein
MSRRTSPPRSPPPDPPALSPHEIREWSVRARVHPNTLARFLRGEPVRSTVLARITDTLPAPAPVNPLPPRTTGR